VQIVRKFDGDATYYLARLAYNVNGQLWQVINYTYNVEWDDDLQRDVVYNLLPRAAREYRYDDLGRQRYLVRAAEFDGVSGQWSAIEDTWTEYDGVSPYADYELDAGGGTTVGGYFEPGVFRVREVHTAGGEPVQEFFHGDHLGTARLLTSVPAAPGDAAQIAWSAAFTSFGELLDASGGGGGDAGFPGGGSPGDVRYGYVGAHGYEAGLLPAWGPFYPDTPAPAWLHVGARWYDPTSGRFLQRDPIGISGGDNVYAYVSNTPAYADDPYGLAMGLLVDTLLYAHDEALIWSVGGVACTLTEAIMYPFGWLPNSPWTPGTAYKGLYKAHRKITDHYVKDNFPPKRVANGCDCDCPPLAVAPL